MTKYARIEKGKTVDVVTAPDPLPSWAADDAAWLAKQFPTLNGFVQVPDDTQPGATDNGDGTFTNPSPKPPPVKTTKAAYDIYRAFSVTERKAIRNAAKVDDDVEEIKDSLDKAVTADRLLDITEGSEVDLALDALEAAGLITEGRKAEIVS